MSKEKNNIITSKLNKRLMINFAAIFGLILTVVLFAILTNGRTISPINLRILSNQFIVTALVAIGAIFAFACGALDMSLGGSVCLTAICGGIVATKTNSIPAMVLSIIIVSMLIAAFKGIVAAYLKLPVFIVTIVFGSVLTAIGLTLLGNETTISVSKLISVKEMTLINIIFILLFYLFALLLFNYTKIGKSCKLQGGNLLASNQSGINARFNVIISFLMGGVGVALAVLIIILRTKTISASTGGTIGTDIMVAIVLGGMPLSGGPRSKISAAIIGAATITVLNNGLAVIGLSTGAIQIVRGVIFLVVVFVTSMSYRTKLLPR